MQARTLTTSHALVKTQCRHCGRLFKTGDQVLAHNLGKDAPYDLRVFAVHASCAAKVLGRLKIVTSQAARAAEFRAAVEQIRETRTVLAHG